MEADVIKVELPGGDPIILSALSAPRAIPGWKPIFSTDYPTLWRLILPERDRGPESYAALGA
jgi:hypothetical protein